MRTLDFLPFVSKTSSRWNRVADSIGLSTIVVDGPFTFLGVEEPHRMHSSVEGVHLVDKQNLLELIA